MPSNDSKDHQNLLIAIGSSAGGYPEIVKIVSALPKDFQASIILASHRSPNVKNSLVDALAHRAAISVIQPDDEDAVECTHIYVGAPSQSVAVDGTLFDIQDDRTDRGRISRIDDLFESVAQSAGKNAVGILLSGLLSDGVAGMQSIGNAGGVCIVQSPQDAQYEMLPKNALANATVHFAGTTEDIVEVLIAIASERQCISPGDDC